MQGLLIPKKRKATGESGFPLINGVIDHFLALVIFLGVSIAACAAASRAMGTLKAEQLT